MKFLESALLGVKTNTKDSEMVLSRCLDLAYADMMTAGRYYSSMFQHTKKEICQFTKMILIEQHFAFSRNVIYEVSLMFSSDEKIGTGNTYVTGYGLAQKLVNMCFKYLYIFSDYIFQDGAIPDFSNCDCPLDSIILGRASIKDCVWSKLTANRYAQCQEIVSSILKTENLDAELKKLGNLAFDFLYW